VVSTRLQARARVPAGRRTALLVLVVLLAAAAAAALHAAPPGVDPRAMVLHAVDLRAGFSLQNGSYASNVQAAKESAQGAHVSAAQLARWGRINGYRAEYRRSAPAGLIDLYSSANTYKTATGAQASQKHALAVATAANLARAGIQGWKQLSPGRAIGDFSAVFTGIDRSGKTPGVIYAIQWRYRTVNASVIGEGAKGTVAADVVVKLARRQQARLKTVLG
jgi:hypothetical protein